MEEPMEPHEILARPYGRVLIPEPNGQFTAEIIEFPNCVASGNSATDALANLEQVAADWIAAALEQGQDIPAPMESADYSGRLVLRMPKGLHRRAALLAEREGASLNQFIVTSLAEAVGEKAKPHVVPVFQAATNVHSRSGI
jgi:predicted RNase H-like HicB family nuclease